MRIWIVDAFTDRVFTGNPAGVVPLDAWLPDAILQAIAAENKLSETAFFVPTGLRGNYQLRWFTPSTEVPICGHATLAAGAVLLTEIDPSLEVVVFDTQAGALIVRNTSDGFTLDLPRRARAFWEAPDELRAALGGAAIADAFIGEYANVVLEDESAVRDLKPDFAAIDRIIRGPHQGCMAVTAPADEGKSYDFVSRFFGPGVGLPEDPVTGSAFADLAPYWADRLGLESVVGFQASERGGFTRAIQTLSSVRLFGQVAVYLRGELDESVAQIPNREPEAPARRRRTRVTLAPIFDDEPVLIEEKPQTIVVVKNPAPSRRVDEETLVRVVKEADIGAGETIRVYEIEADSGPGRAANE
ncbi:MAG: PhzF family phenazine biosynthesis protein [Caulobacterales bacterium]